MNAFFTTSFSSFKTVSIVLRYQAKSPSQKTSILSPSVISLKFVIELTTLDEHSKFPKTPYVELFSFVFFSEDSNMLHVISLPSRAISFGFCED